MQGENRGAFTPLRHEGVNKGLIRFHSRSLRSDAYGCLWIGKATLAP